MRCHLTINGSPLCDHTGCQAGDRDRAKAERVGQLDRILCGYEDARSAADALEAWATAHPSHTVGIVAGDCPSLLKALDR